MRSAQLLGLTAALVFGVPAVAQTGPRPATPATTAEQSTPAAPADAAANREQSAAVASLTQTDVEAWLDGYMPITLRQADIAGAVVVVVKDGQILTKKGYGYADVAAKKPVDPDRTLFRPGSVSKLFTWTAVMQLVEQGKLDLDADVNGYLDFKIPERDGRPVTLRNVMTHTAGFEEQVKGLMSDAEEGVSVDPFVVHLKRWVPKRIFAPGQTPAYSNYATSLAGYIVERTSGMPFDDYIDKHLFAPLEMRRSTFRQPLPEALKPDMSKGYAVASLPDKPFEIVGPAPAGSLSAAGADMGNFMIAHLQKGRFKDAQILKPETAELMHGEKLTVLPRVHRMALGFYESDTNGRRAIAHAGDTQWFHSDLNLFIDDGVGLYISMNSPGKEGAAGAIRMSLLRDFADRYLPGPAPTGAVDEKTALEHARMIAGLYDNSRRMDSSFFNLLSLASPVKVVANEDHTISVSLWRSPSGTPLKWREIEPFVWLQPETEALLAAEAREGRITRFTFEPLSPFMMFDATPAYRSPSWLLPALIVGVGALLLTTLAWPISALTRKHYGAAYALAGPDARAHRLVRIASAVVLALCIAWVVTIAMMMSSLSFMSGALDPWLWVLQLASLIAFFGAAFVGGWNASVVVRSGRKWYAKAWAIVLALSFVTILWVGLVHKLIAFDVNY